MSHSNQVTARSVKALLDDYGIIPANTHHRAMTDSASDPAVTYRCRLFTIQVWNGPAYVAVLVESPKGKADCVTQHTDIASLDDRVDLLADRELAEQERVRSQATSKPVRRAANAVRSLTGISGSQGRSERPSGIYGHGTGGPKAPKEDNRTMAEKLADLESAIDRGEV